MLLGCGGSTPTASHPSPTPTPTPAIHNRWTWVNGGQAPAAGLGQPGIYGTKGAPSSSNLPGGRGGAAGWADSSGNLWFFGGSGLDAAGSSVAELNDLWKFSTATSQWTWIAGNNIGNQKGVYGTRGITAAANTPGGRTGMAAWQDPNGAFWIFGGSGYNSSGMLANMNDLWTYTPSTGQWTWMGGSATGDTTFDVGSYGTLGVPSPQNIPGARHDPAFATDVQGNFWLFGGYIEDAQGESDSNDLWEYSTQTKQWTWIAGSPTTGALGVYGAQGVASTTNTPGNREQASTWIDSKGNLWLFGGTGFDSTAARIYYNDLWKFNPSAKTWTWIAGSSSSASLGVYGTQAVSAPENTPGARRGSAAWRDISGNLLLFGGEGVGTTSTMGELNDLWSFSPTTNQWTWLRGSKITNAPAVYGLLGTAAGTNDPGNRDFATSITDASGTLWIFGGYTSNAQGPDGIALNDLWKYVP